MKPTWGEKLFYQVNAILLGLAALSALLPLFNILSLSLSSNHAILAGKVTFLPVEFTLSSYAALLKGTRVPEAFMNSLIITFVGVAFNMIFTVLAAYPLSRSNFIGRRPMTLLIIFTMLFSGGLIPSYLLIKSLGILNSYWSLWLPGLVSAYNMLIMKSFLKIFLRSWWMRHAWMAVANGAWRSKSFFRFLHLFWRLWRYFMGLVIGIPS